MTIASVWPEPWRVMWAIAASIESTTADGQDLVEVLGVPVGRLGGDHCRHDAPGPASSPRSSTPRTVEGLGGPGKEARGDRAVDEQRLGRVADAGALGLGVDDDPDRHLEIGRGIDVDVAVARDSASTRASWPRRRRGGSGSRRRAGWPGR